MTVWSWLRLTISLWLLRKAVKGAGWLLLFAGPGAVAGHHRDDRWAMPPRGCAAGRRPGCAAPPPPPLALTAIYAAGRRVRQHGRAGRRAGPGPGLGAGWHHLAALAAARTFVLLAPAVIPAGLALAAGLWAWRSYAIMAGIGGRMASAPVTFDARQWNRQVRAAEGRTAAPGSVPLLARGGNASRSAGPSAPSPARGSRSSPSRPPRAPGTWSSSARPASGKTNLMMRLWAGWYTAALDAYYAGKGNRPLLIVLDCKGGRDARRKADRTRRLLYGAGARRVALWPDEARVSIWDLPPPTWPCCCTRWSRPAPATPPTTPTSCTPSPSWPSPPPPGPPWSTASFLQRLDAAWLEAAWGDGQHPDQAGQVRAAARHLGDIQLRYTTLLGRLGRRLDGPGTLDEADAWYFILEGTREPSVAEAQALALTELAARAATSPARPAARHLAGRR